MEYIKDAELEENSLQLSVRNPESAIKTYFVTIEDKLTGETIECKTHHYSLTECEDYVVSSLLDEYRVLKIEQPDSKRFKIIKEDK